MGPMDGMGEYGGGVFGHLRWPLLRTGRGDLTVYHGRDSGGGANGVAFNFGANWPHRRRYLWVTISPVCL